MTESRLGWFGVRCIYKIRDQPQYEERVTIWRARSVEEAVELAETEAEEYAATGGLEYLHLAQIFESQSESVRNGSEVFSLIRDSGLAPDEYINRFFETGSERQGAIH